MDNGCFQDVLHIPQLSIKLLSVYKITHSDRAKRVEFTPQNITISEMTHNSTVVIGKEDRYARLYSLSKFASKSSSAMLLMHANQESAMQHERFMDLNYKYLQQFNRKEWLQGFPIFNFLKGFVVVALWTNIQRKSSRKER